MSREDLLNKMKNWWNTTSKTQYDVRNLITGKINIDGYTFMISSNPNSPDILAVKGRNRDEIISFSSSEKSNMYDQSDLENILVIKFNNMRGGKRKNRRTRKNKKSRKYRKKSYSRRR